MKSGQTRFRTLASALGLSVGLLLVQPPSVMAAEEAVPVSVVSLFKGTAARDMRLTGTVVAAKRANLSARVEGAVAEVLVDAGSQVRQGDRLLTLDASLEQHELARLQSQAAAAKAQAKEAKRLVAEAQRLTTSNHLPQNELALRQAALEQAEALLQSATAEVAAQQQRLHWHELYAPFDGVVVQKFTEQGEWVTPGTAVVELVATDDSYVDVQVPQAGFGLLTDNTNIRIQPENPAEPAVEAYIAAQVPVADAASRTFRIRLKPKPASQHRLLPGAAALVQFSTDLSEAVTLVPKDAILRTPDGGFSLFTVEQQDGRYLALRKRVELGRQEGTQVEITSDLPANAQVVVRGNEILRDQQAVRITGNLQP